MCHIVILEFKRKTRKTKEKAVFKEIMAAANYPELMKNMIPQI